MVSSILSGFVAFVFLASGVSSVPLKGRAALALPPNTSPVRRTDPGSLSGWGGLESMNGFDDFYGSGNFDGRANEQVIVIQEQQTVCRRQQIEIIQQKLVILQEMAKRVVTELVCDVETQTIVIEQFNSGFSNFKNDVSRKSNKQVGYDKDIASKIGNMVNSDGSLNIDDLGFSGKDVGKNSVVPSGNNWDSNTSPDKVASADAAAESAKSAEMQNQDGSESASSAMEAESTSAAASETASAAEASASM